MSTIYARQREGAALLEVLDSNPLPTLDSTVVALLEGLRDPLRLYDSVRVTCAAAGNYSALDVLSASATDTAGRATRVNNIARAPYGTGTVRAVRARCSEDAVLTRLRLHWFRDAPAVVDVEMDDNAAFAITSDAGRLNYLGSTLLNAFVDLGSHASASETKQLEEPLRTNSRRGAFLVLTTEDAETNETVGMTIDLDIYGF